MNKIMLLVLLPLIIMCVTGCDRCAMQGRYGDGICDQDCPKPDLDCEISTTTIQPTTSSSTTSIVLTTTTSSVIIETCDVPNDVHSFTEFIASMKMNDKINQKD